MNIYAPGTVCKAGSFLILPHKILPPALKGKYSKPISHMRKPNLRGMWGLPWCPAKIGCEYPFIRTKGLYSFSSNTMCYEHIRHWINTCWVIPTNIKYSFQIVRDSRCWAHVQGGFHTICAIDIGTEQLLLNIKESPETLMVRRLSFMKVLNLCFFKQHHWGRDRGYNSLILK